VVVFLSHAVVFSQQVIIEPACFNTKNDDYGLRKLQDKLVFVSAPKMMNQKSGFSLPGEYSDLFTIDSCKLKSTQLFSERFLANAELSSRMNDGPISATDSLIFVTINQSNQAISKLDIYYSVLSKKGWSDFIPFYLNSSKYNITHPYYDDKNKALYFCSDANGNMDIYAISFTRKGEGKKIDLPGLNSPGNEYFPFYHDGALYFSSDREGSLGGLDIYKYVNGQVTNLGQPYNSEFDDLSMMFIGQNEGYFSTNRQSKGIHDDVFKFTVLPEVKIKKDSINAGKKEPVVLTKSELELQLIALNDSLKKSRAMILSLNKNKELVALFDRAYEKMDIEIPDDFKSMSLDQLSKLKDIMNATINTYSNTINENTQTGANNTTAQGGTNVNGTPTGGNNATAQGGTNVPGTQTGSNNSTAQGGTNVTGKQTGSNNSTAQGGTNVNGTQTGGNNATAQGGTNVTGTQTGSNNSTSQGGTNVTGTQTGGNNATAQGGTNVTGTQTGSNNSTAQGGTNVNGTQTGGNNTTAMGGVNTKTSKTDISLINEIIKTSQIEQVKFKFDSWTIENEFEELIMGVVIIMKTDKNIKIRLEGHTDNVGKKDYNLNLSKYRAQSVRDFIVSRGIDKSRVDVSYFGAEKPIADNKTDKGRYFNRRVEMILY
jgi:outer membrane protein OmpA-like peptidoglycan-associated protein